MKSQYQVRRLNDQEVIMGSILVAKEELEKAMKTNNTTLQGEAVVRLSNLYALLDIPRLKQIVRDNNLRRKSA